MFLQLVRAAMEAKRTLIQLACLLEHVNPLRLDSVERYWQPSYPGTSVWTHSTPPGGQAIHHNQFGVVHGS